MKNYRHPPLFLLLTGFLLITSCESDPWSKQPEYYIINIIGTNEVINYTSFHCLFIQSTALGSDTLEMAVTYGDLLFLGDEFFYRFDPDDGLFLSFSFDTTIDAVHLNNELHLLNLSSESKAWDWIEDFWGEQG